MRYECTEAQFLKDVDGHVMTVIRDDGLHRHIRFKQPGTICYYFDLITWPGHLLITGDCGTFAFQRLEDMFKFFRMDKRDFNHRPDRTLQINPHYWAEKVISESRGAGVEKYSEDKFRAAIKEYYDQHFASELAEETSIRADASDEYPLEPDEIAAMEHAAEKRAELWEEIEDQVLAYAADEHPAQHAAYHFEHEGFSFEDFFERNLKEYTFHFIWNLYAIAWGISQYDASNSTAPVEQAEAAGG